MYICIISEIYLLSNRECDCYLRKTLNFSNQLYIFLAGATNIKWNKLSRHVLATTHCGDIKIWDERKNTAPIQYITAYISNVS